MDKKGMEFGWMKLIVVLVVIVVVIIGFRYMWNAIMGQVKGIAGISAGDIEYAKRHAEIGAEQKQAVEAMNKILTDAAGLVKSGKYEEAVNKYIEYYKECKRLQNAAPCVLSSDGIKFRILNVIREKYFNNPDTEKSFFSEKYENLITEKEFDDNIKISLAISKRFEEPHTLRDIRSTPSDENTKSYYYLAVFLWDIWIRKDKTGCYLFIEDFNKFNERFGFAKLKEEEQKALGSYRFLQPLKDTEAVCKT